MTDPPEPPLGRATPDRALGDEPAAVSDHRREALISSLRHRFAIAQARGDAAAKQALFKEAVYLNLPPELWQEPQA
jgi:hypothetical protein